MSGDRWTDQEFGFLMDHADWSARDVAEALGRSVGTVYSQRYQMRKGWTPSAPDLWTVEEDAIIIATPNLTAEQVARRLPGRTKHGVEWRRKCIAKADPSIGFGDYATRNKDPQRIGGRRLIAKTCRHCGLLLDGSWFYSKDGKGWRSKCARCFGDPQRETFGARSERAQALTAPLASNHGAPWLESDDEVLRDTTLTLTEKAVRLGRTYRAVSTRCCVLRDSGARRTDRTRPEDAQWRIDAPNAADALWEAS